MLFFKIVTNNFVSALLCTLLMSFNFFLECAGPAHSKFKQISDLKVF